MVVVGRAFGSAACVFGARGSGSLVAVVAVIAVLVVPGPSSAGVARVGPAVSGACVTTVGDVGRGGCGESAALTRTTAGFDQVGAPARNVYRYAGKRRDSGSGFYDMGARYYSQILGRFVQRDQYWLGLEDLGLAADALSQNRYALAAGNPVSFVEVDGHRVDTTSDLSGDSPFALEIVKRNEAEETRAVWRAGGGDLVGLVSAVSGVSDVVGCFVGRSVQACGWAAAGFIPVGKLSRTGKVLVAHKHGKAAKAGTSVVPSARYKLGQWGEARLAAELGGAGTKPRSPFSTSLGKRYVDRLVGGVAYEAKAGIDVGLTSSIRRQVLKDAELLATGQVRAAEWHFFQGAQPELIAFLRQSGIKPVVHP